MSNSNPMNQEKEITIYIIVPLYNEAENIDRLINGIRRFIEEHAQYQIRCIFVDDNSTDKTKEKLLQHREELNFTLLQHDKNRGPGHAFATAFEYIASNLSYDDYVVTKEGDNTSRDETLNVMLERSVREGQDLILASPYAYGGSLGDTNLLRSMLSHFANGFVKMALGIHGIHTMSSFYRVYKGSLIKKLQKRYGTRILERSGFESMVELLMKIIALDATISEVSFELDTANRAGKSKMKVIKTSLGYLSLWKDKSRWMSIPNA